MNAKMTWEEIEEALRTGTATQLEIAEKTGISQSWISRKVRHMRGKSWEEMDVAKRLRGADHSGSEGQPDA